MRPSRPLPASGSSCPPARVREEGSPPRTPRAGRCSSPSSGRWSSRVDLLASPFRRRDPLQPPGRRLTQRHDSDVPRREPLQELAKALHTSCLNTKHRRVGADGHPAATLLGGKYLSLPAIEDIPGGGAPPYV